MSLTGAAARSLRAMAHSLVPVVHLGKEGVTDALLVAVTQALHDHELIKVKVLQEAPLERDEAAAQISDGTLCEVVQIIGRILVLYKPHPKKPKIPVPKGYLARKKGDKITFLKSPKKTESEEVDPALDEITDE